MALFSIIEALEILSTSIPHWNSTLDELNGQIALRQVELARLEEPQRPPTRSIKNKGSTESLRPKDGDENPFSGNDTGEGIPMNPFDTLISNPKGFSPPARRTSSSIARAAANSPTHTAPTSNPRESTGAIARQASISKSPAQLHGGRNVLRKRKTESLASGESIAPKHRTRSMIIIYYDGAVQSAFEELVKFVSGSRNSMRKGKMAAKMAEMKRAAELEVEEEQTGDDDDVLARGNLADGQRMMLAADPLAVGSAEDGMDDTVVPVLNFRSTRNMGPRNLGARDTRVVENVGSTLSLGLLRGYRRSSGDSLDIFDQLDKGLEWCQSQCEHGAHNFLREGECDTEINNIKKKLLEIRETTEKEIERLKQEELATGNTSVKILRQDGPKPRSRELKTPQLRREYGAPKELEVDDVEVEDEAVDDMQLPTKLVFKRSGQI